MWVNSTIFATGSGARGVLPGGRVLSRRSPSTPSSIEAVLPAPDTVLRLAGLSHDDHRAESVIAQKNDARPSDVFLRALRVRDNRFKAMPVARSERE